MQSTKLLSIKGYTRYPRLQRVYTSVHGNTGYRVIEGLQGVPGSDTSKVCRGICGSTGFTWEYMGIQGVQGIHGCTGYTWVYRVYMGI